LIRQAIVPRRVFAALLFGAAGGVLEAQMFPPPLRNPNWKFRWSSDVQLRYSAVDNSEDHFALRRFKLMVGGNLTPRIPWYAQGLYKDGNDSPTDGRACFQEAWLRFALRKEFPLAAGQFKPAFDRERFTPDFEIHTMDRSLVTDALTPDGPYINSFHRDRAFRSTANSRRDSAMRPESSAAGAPTTSSTESARWRSASSFNSRSMSAYGRAGR
jgi:hypothetical protein